MKKLIALITLFAFSAASLPGAERPTVKSADDLLVQLERVFSDTNWKSKTERETARKTVEALSLAYIKSGCEGTPEACAEQIADAMSSRGYPQTTVDSTRKAIADSITIANNDRLTQKEKQVEINRILTSRINAVPTGEAFDPMIAIIAPIVVFLASIGVGIYGLVAGKYVLGGTCLGIDAFLIVIGIIHAGD